MADQPDLDALAVALAALDEAMTYGYATEAAYEAASEHLAGLDAEQVREVAAAMAALVAQWSVLASWTPHPPALKWDSWVRWGRCRVADGEAP